jgi:hypothetical protein
MLRLVSGAALVGAYAMWAFSATAANYTGPAHTVPQAACHPHCNSSPAPGEGDDVAFVDRLSVGIDPSSAHLACSPGPESQLDPSHVFVDNGNHIAVAWIRSRTRELTCQIVGTTQ